ncbi:MAG: 50S ribosomal protein L30 [Thermotogae bacterium]|nr:50S ribosomal protein L30 [Thermotogota bacterium]
MKKLRITLKRSLIDKSKKTKRILRSLGLRRRGQTVIHNDVPSIRGQVEKVKRYLVVEEIEG